MPTKAKEEKKNNSEKFAELMRTFGNTVGEIMDDPELRKKAREFAECAIDAAAKVVDSKIKDNEVKAKFRDVGKAAQSLGKSLEKQFNTAEE
jgi:[ribosomal protein S5]-alanine N-acetyltransferase